MDWWTNSKTTYGYFFITLDGSHIRIAVKLSFKVTKNMTEYEACITRLEALCTLGAREVEVYGDLALVIS